MDTITLLENYIYPNLDIESLLFELNPKKKTTYYTLTCPICNKKEAYIPNKTKLIPVIICNRLNKCAYKSSIWRYLKESRGLSNKEVLHLLAQYSGINLDDFKINQSHYNYYKPKFPKPKIVFEKTYISIPTQQNKNIENEIKNFHNLEDVDKFLVIATLIYQFSLSTNQTPKNNYYLSRKITPPKDIGFLSLSDFNNLEKFLLSKIDSDSLHYFNIFKNNHFKYNFSNFAVIPSFDIYTNLISAIRLRNISPNAKPKEIEISFSRIANPLPYPLTNQKLRKFNEFYFTEGHIDALSLNIPNVVGVEGVNSLSEYNLTLFKNKKIFIVFDNDEAGYKAAKKLSQKLSNLSIQNQIVTFDNYKDINEIIQHNKNPFDLFKFN